MSTPTRRWFTALIGALGVAATILALVSFFTGKDHLADYFGPSAGGASSDIPTITAAPSPTSESDSGCLNRVDQKWGYGWGPVRPIYSGTREPDHATFNSTSDNPNIGDERAFVGIKDARSNDPGGWLGNIEAEPGHQYRVRVYVRNDASSTTAGSTKLMLDVPTCTGSSIAIYGFVDSPDAFPGTVWSGVGIWARNQFNLDYVEGSAVLYNNAHGDGVPLGEAESRLLSGTGQLLGYDSLDGTFRGGFQYAAYVSFLVQPQFAR
jgi:hypothetical protein